MSSLTVTGVTKSFPSTSPLRKADASLLNRSTGWNARLLLMKPCGLAWVQVLTNHAAFVVDDHRPAAEVFSAVTRHGGRERPLAEPLPSLPEQRALYNQLVLKQT